jgi:hypothetical protein
MHLARSLRLPRMFAGYLRSERMHLVILPEKFKKKFVTYRRIGNADLATVTRFDDHAIAIKLSEESIGCLRPNERCITHRDDFTR